MALGWFVCGDPVFGTADTLTIPITADVARSDPALGATIILIYYQLDNFESAEVSGAGDTASPTDDYSFCLFTDGLNHYSGSLTNPLPGLLANDLVNGTDSILLSLNKTPDFFIAACAIALTGVKLLGSGSGPIFPDPSLPGFLSELTFNAEAPVGGGGSFATGVEAGIDSGGAISFLSPSTATDEDWDWQGGELAFYVAFGDNTTDHLGWSWADINISDFVQWDFATGAGQAQAAVGVATVVPTAAGPSMGGVWGDATLAVPGIAGLSYGIGGEGPGPCSTPPAGNYPVFSNQFRAGA